MLRSLVRDPANALTGFGVVVAILAMALVLQRNSRWAAVLLLVALMIDHIDGPVARRLRNRGEIEKKMGAALDSLADIVSAGAVPAILVLVVAEQEMVAAVTAAALVLAAATRLSYFSIVGLDARHRFTGLPVTYTVPAISAALVVSAHTELAPGHLVLPVAWVLTVGQLAPIRVQALSGIGYVIVTAVVMVLISLLVAAPVEPLTLVGAP